MTDIEDLIAATVARSKEISHEDEPEFVSAFEELRDVRVRFWRCPVRDHRGGYPQPLRVTVEWRDGVAYCTTAGCGRNSADPRGTTPGGAL